MRSNCLIARFWEYGKALKPSFSSFWLFSLFFRICNYRFLEVVDCLGQLLAETNSFWKKLGQAPPHGAYLCSTPAVISKVQTQHEPQRHRLPPSLPPSSKTSGHRSRRRRPSSTAPSSRFHFSPKSRLHVAALPMRAWSIGWSSPGMSRFPVLIHLSFAFLGSCSSIPSPWRLHRGFY